MVKAKGRKKPTLFNYKNEAEFIAQFLVPLLQRMGYSIVVPYHGKREFGRDLVFGEIDRWGHVQYHGLQAKYVHSVSLNGSDDLVRDARQAFANPFRHPNTGADARIATFFAVNGGAISNEASENFFNELATPHGGHVRLLDGQALVILDRFASAGTTSDASPVLRGLRGEIRWNEGLWDQMKPLVQERIKMDAAVTVPIQRFRVNACAAYLQRPFLHEKLRWLDVIDYAEYAEKANRCLEAMVLSDVSTRKTLAQGVMSYRAKMAKVVPVIESAIDDCLMQLVPLVKV